MRISEPNCMVFLFLGFDRKRFYKFDLINESLRVSMVSQRTSRVLVNIFKTVVE